MMQGAIKGKNQKLKLEKCADELLYYYNAGLPHTNIAKLLGCSRLTVAKFLKRFPIKNGAYVNPPATEQK